MSWLGLRSPALVNCPRCLLASTKAFRSVGSSASIRRATTAAKPRARKPVSPSQGAVGVAKKSPVPNKATGSTTAAPTAVRTPPAPRVRENLATASSRPKTPTPPASTTRPEVQSAPRPVDPNSPEYKRAVWQYTATLVAIPFLLVTSYFLYKRLTSELGQQNKALAHQLELQPQKAPQASDV